jgi:hypothetical protein
VFGGAALVYVGVRAVSHGRLAAVVEAPKTRLVGAALVALATLGTATTAIAAAVDIL